MDALGDLLSDLSGIGRKSAVLKSSKELSHKIGSVSHYNLNTGRIRH
jgi:hypothetical protein